MSVKRIESRDNPFFREQLALAEKRQARRETGQTLIDGEHLLEEAVKAGLQPRWLIVSDEADNLDVWRIKLPKVPVVSLSPALFARLSPVVTPSGIMAVIDIPVPTSAKERCIVLLEDIQDPGNMGALIRTAAAAGVDAVYLSKGCAEAWSPKTLRGGQGAHFHLRVHEGADLVAVARAFPGKVFSAALRSSGDLYALD